MLLIARSTRHRRPSASTPTSTRTAVPVAAATSSATSCSKRDLPLRVHRAQPAPATREATVVLHICPLRQRHWQMSFEPAANNSGPRPGTVWFTTNSAATLGDTSERARPGRGFRRAVPLLALAQRGQPLFLVTRLVTVAVHLYPQLPHRQAQRSTEDGRSPSSPLPGFVRFSRNSWVIAGAIPAAVAASCRGPRRLAARAWLAHAGQPRPCARLATTDSHSVEHTPHRQRQRCLLLTRNSAGPMSGRSRLRTNSAASLGFRSFSALPAGAWARERARRAQAHSGQPVPAWARAATVVAHWYLHNRQRHRTLMLLPRPRFAMFMSRPGVVTASARRSVRPAPIVCCGAGPGTCTILVDHAIARWQAADSSAA
jgi:hypothetical protein